MPSRGPLLPQDPKALAKTAVRTEKRNFVPPMDPGVRGSVSIDLKYGFLRRRLAHIFGIRPRRPSYLRIQWAHPRAPFLPVSREGPSYLRIQLKSVFSAPSRRPLLRQDPKNGGDNPCFGHPPESPTYLRIQCNDVAFLGLGCLPRAPLTSGSKRRRLSLGLYIILV